MNEHFLTEIEIKQFKCFTDFKAGGFKRVNLIGGKNNIGKTALMEACYINVNSKNLNRLIKSLLNIKYGRNRNFSYEQTNDIDTLNSIGSYAVQSNLSRKEFFIVKNDTSKKYIFYVNDILMEFNEKDLNIFREFDVNNIKFIATYGLIAIEIASDYHSVQRIDKEDELNEFLNEFDDSIESFKVIGDKPQCKKNGVYRDITEFGDGLKHYISIICALYACGNGYLFIDEIDNGIYYEHFDRLWEIILTLSKQTNCQVFVTTHSKEMLESFARVAKKLDEQDISYTLLVKNKNQELKTISLGYKGLLETVAQDIEVR